ncbi:cyanophycinase [Clostridium algidicarnis]|uniref:Cyanophycinase n=2 Tax=Clostridium algidicarnis TaxID=37659 RepID=A0A2S6FZN4_9CLOT|nr:cyanophycinase [Clostridium algidicarnis]MBB6631022.1 cyanophycinase [Clostridium algidicarnis]MBB6698199.1 cyanophycinase [Clostridium algidicarnis]MBU3194240.1 cyanophycinase [Clostridium algidicarnis]MBU3197159.1 cyanophycinase [Clostridium algidicarnis]MBU3205938.1 cyanophycinase [Clostridium algidicarnis]
MEGIDKENLIIIGGAEDKKGNKEILRYVSSIINKSKDKLLIATVATENPKEVGESYNELFVDLGVKNVDILYVNSRKEATYKNNIQKMKEASLVFFTGGDQLRITSVLGGTPLYEAMKAAYEEGCVFVGTSAGASVMSHTMIIEGNDDESPRKCTLKMAPGLGFIKDIIIDQHFAQRGRIGRLLVGIAENPEVLGIGIDEDTAIVVNRNGTFKVIGSGAVYVIDGRSITKSNVSEQFPEELLSIFDVNMHVLKKGNGFNLNSKVPFEEDRLKNEDN